MFQTYTCSKELKVSIKMLSGKNSPNVHDRASKDAGLINLADEYMGAWSMLMSFQYQLKGRHFETSIELGKGKESVCFKKSVVIRYCVFWHF